MNNLFKTRQTRKISQLCLSIAFIGLTACNGGSSDPDTTAPRSILKSPLVSRTTTNSAINVTGSSSDSQSAIASVKVNGLKAESEDGYQNWSANIPLLDKIEQLNIETQDRAGNTSSEIYDLNFSKLNLMFSEASTLAIDDNNHTLLINDALQQANYASSLTSPALIQLSSDADESGLLRPHSSVFDRAGNQELILDLRETEPVTQAILARNVENNNLSTLVDGLGNIIDMSIDNDKRILYVLLAPENEETGGIIKVFDIDAGLAFDAWPTLSDNSKSGPDLVSPSAMVFHNNLLFCADSAANNIVSIDLETGNKTIISDGQTNSSNPIIFSYIRDMTAGSVSTSSEENDENDENGDDANQETRKLWLVDEDSRSIIEIDTHTGLRSILTQSHDNKGIPFKNFNQIVADIPNNRLLVADLGLNVIFSVQFETGERDLFVSNKHGNGPSMENPVALKYGGENEAFVVDNQLESIFSINLETGNRKVVSAYGKSETEETGKGPQIDEPVSIVINPSLTHAWVSMREQENILEVDLESGDRSLLEPDPSLGATAFKLPSGLVFDSDNNRLLVSDIYLDKVQAIELDTKRTTIAASQNLTENNGIKLSKPLDITLDEVNKRIYAVDSVLQAVIVWDTQSNASKVLSSLTIGSGVSLLKPIAIELDLIRNLAYVADEKLNSIVAVNLDNGDRRVLSNRAIGSGPTFKKLSGISFKQNSNFLIASDAKENAIFSINISNGNRSILSK